MNARIEHGAVRNQFQEHAMSDTKPATTTPSALQIALDLTCALVSDGMFRFRMVDSQGRLDELLHFISDNVPRIEADAGTLSVRPVNALPIAAAAAATS
jgi:hypothetical protein